MDLQLKNKKALVTGSTAGIGLAIAKSLLREAVSVIINGRSADRIQQAIEEIKKDSHIILDNGPFKGAEGIVKHLNKNSIQLLLVDLGFLITINR